MANVGDRESGTSQTQVVLTTPGKGRYWHLEQLVVKGNQDLVLTVQSPAKSNIFRLKLFRNEGFDKTWRDPGLPALENAEMVIDVNRGNYDINYKAVVR